MMAYTPLCCQGSNTAQSLVMGCLMVVSTVATAVCPSAGLGLNSEAASAPGQQQVTPTTSVVHARTRHAGILLERLPKRVFTPQ
jgi:hypothetical protein